MKKQTTPCSLTRISTLVLLAAFPAIAAAQVTPQSFDFGSGTGQTTFGDAGFTAASDASFNVQNQANKVTFNSTANNQTGGITRTFTGLGDGARNNFTITADFEMIMYQSWVTSNWRPASILLFGDGSSVNDMNNNSLSVQLRSNSTAGDNGSLFQIANGISDGSPFVSTTFGDHIQHPDRLQISVDVSFSGTNDMLVEASLTRLNDASGQGGSVGESGDFLTISHLFEDSADTFIDGTHFGAAARLMEGPNWRGRGGEVALESFSVVPEPSTYALMAGLAVLGLVIVRRRRS